MATNLRPIPPPVTVRMVDENGMVTRAWGDFFQNLHRYAQANDASIPDGTYTLGTGTIQGEITVSRGHITAIQEVVA